METESSISPIDYSELLLQEINEYYSNLCNEDKILLSIVKLIADSKTIWLCPKEGHADPPPSEMTLIKK